MKQVLLNTVLAIVMLSPGSAGFAHHGFQVAYDTTSPTTKTGTVTHLQWTNPHCQVYIDVKNPDGTVTNWGIEMTNPRALVRLGITPALFPEGKIIEITFSPSRSGANRGLIRQAKIDGKPLFDERKAADDQYAK